MVHRSTAKELTHMLRSGRIRRVCHFLFVYKIALKSCLYSTWFTVENLFSNPWQLVLSELLASSKTCNSRSLLNSSGLKCVLTENSVTSMARGPYNKLLTILASLSRTEEYCPSVIFVRTSLRSDRTATNSVQRRHECHFLVSCLLRELSYWSRATWNVKARFHLAWSFIAIDLLEFFFLFWFTQNVVNRENSFYECERSTNCLELFAENVDGNKTKHRGERRARIL